MIQLKSLYPNFFLFGSAGIVNADSSILGWLGNWVKSNMVSFKIMFEELLKELQ